jgi:cytochrome c
LPEHTFSSAIDMDFGPDGALYILEYGSAWFRGNANSRLVKIEYNAGNRKPNVEATANKTSGAVPFTADFSSEGTNDYDSYDANKLSYEWKITSGNGFNQILNAANPSFTFTETGTYQVMLTVTDTRGEQNSKTFEIIAGNEPPQVSIDLMGKNKTFYFGDKELAYQILVSDKEDGSSADGKIPAEAVAVTFDYVPAGFDPIAIASKQSGAETQAALNIGKNLIDNSDCKSCHQIDKTSIGPSYTAVANKYPRTDENTKMLIGKIINGGSGVWGDHAMSAHPELSESNARRMVDYIMTINDTKATVASLPLSGVVKPEVPQGEDGQGGYLLRAYYSDKGAANVGSIAAVEYVALRNPYLDPQLSFVRKGVRLLTTPNISFFMTGDGSHIGFKQLDLTGIRELVLYVAVTSRAGAIGGTVEARLDSPDGPLLGQSEKVVGKKEDGFQRPPQGVNFIDWRRENSLKARIPLDGTNGLHDVYFVFRNPEAKGDEILMSISEIQFKNQ